MELSPTIWRWLLQYSAYRASDPVYNHQEELW